MGENVRIRIEDGHRAARGEPGAEDERAGPWPHVEVPRPDVAPVVVDEVMSGDPPHESGDRPEDKRVVQPQEKRRVLRLALPGGVAAIHAGPSNVLCVEDSERWVGPT